jgi:hypothetical protein
MKNSTRGGNDNHMTWQKRPKSRAFGSWWLKPILALLLIEAGVTVCATAAAQISSTPNVGPTVGQAPGSQPAAAPANIQIKSGVGSALHSTLWVVQATQYLEGHPDVFQHLATTYLGYRDNPSQAPTSSEMIPGGEPTAAALLRLSQLPPSATPAERQIALGSFNSGVSEMATAVYLATVKSDQSAASQRLITALKADDGGLISSSTPVKDLMASLSNTPAF